jgi:ketosteroid isomerase-like protein
MIAASMLAMFVLMYLNSYDIIGHAWFSETRFFMTLIMGGSMTAVMMLFMLGMYPSKRANALTFLAAAVLLASGVGLVRSQVTVDGVDYMEGMIPHHSIAILTSERAGIEDTRVRELADEIIAAQLREIDEMEWLIHDIRTNGIAATSGEAEGRSVPDFSRDEELDVPRGVAAIVNAFHDALASGDTAAVLSLLGEGARILEGGGVETVEEYAGAHLPADIAFAQAVPRERSELEVRVEGDVAWVTSTSRAVGTYRGREIDSRGGELMVLGRDEDGVWRIQSIGWS